jgi:hypothetical protein
VGPLQRRHTEGRVPRRLLWAMHGGAMASLSSLLQGRLRAPLPRPSNATPRNINDRGIVGSVQRPGHACPLHYLSRRPLPTVFIVSVGRVLTVFFFFAPPCTSGQSGWLGFPTAPSANRVPMPTFTCQPPCQSSQHCCHSPHCLSISVMVLPQYDISLACDWGIPVWYPAAFLQIWHWVPFDFVCPRHQCCGSSNLVSQ